MDALDDPEQNTSFCVVDSISIAINEKIKLANMHILLYFTFFANIAFKMRIPPMFPFILLS